MNSYNYSPYYPFEEKLYGIKSKGNADILTWINYGYMIYLHS